MDNRRQHPRLPLELPVQIWGVDATGCPYAQAATARNISFGGALISGIDLPVRPGDLMGIQHGDNKARYRVVWARDSGGLGKNQAAVQRLEGSECPWKEVLEKLALAAVAGNAG
jgi:hypothetical protein